MGLDRFVEGRGFDHDLLRHFHSRGNVHQGRVDTEEGVTAFDESSRFPEITARCDKN